MGADSYEVVDSTETLVSDSIPDSFDGLGVGFNAQDASKSKDRLKVSMGFLMLFFSLSYARPMP